jgi:hypothetical protein
MGSEEGEVHSDVFAARLSYALGYAASPTYFVSIGIIEDGQRLTRAKCFVSRYGAFHTARSKLKQSHKDAPQAPRTLLSELLRLCDRLG